MTDSALEPVATVRPQTPFQRVVSDFCESRLAVFGLVLVAISAFVALFAPWISPQNPFDIASLDLLDAKVPPGTVSGDGKMVYWLGTDGQARDMLSAIFYGMRISCSWAPCRSWWRSPSASWSAWSRPMPAARSTRS